jgi:hypothetical protein
MIAADAPPIAINASVLRQLEGVFVRVGDGDDEKGAVGCGEGDAVGFEDGGRLLSWCYSRRLALSLTSCE